MEYVVVEKREYANSASDLEAKLKLEVMPAAQFDEKLGKIKDEDGENVYLYGESLNVDRAVFDSAVVGQRVNVEISPVINEGE